MRTLGGMSNNVIDLLPYLKIKKWRKIDGRIISKEPYYKPLSPRVFVCISSIMYLKDKKIVTDIEATITIKFSPFNISKIFSISKNNLHWDLYDLDNNLTINQK